MTLPHSADPIRLPANQPRARFYRGGDRIAAFRGAASAERYTPEDWIGSVTPVRGAAPVGQTRLYDGTLLADAITADPLGWLGAEHVRRWGADPKLLVKLLDAGQRLPVHAHPSGAFAAAHLGAAHGKAEAWYILSPGVVYLGLREAVEPARLRELVDAQRTEELLALLNAIEVQPHDTVYVPPGTLHAIGEGVLLAEVQEPEDLSILLEWSGFELDGVADGHLDLGFDLALAVVRTEADGPEQLARLVRRDHAAASSLAPAADEYFRLHRLGDGDELDAGFAIVIAAEGELRLVPSPSDDDVVAAATGGAADPVPLPAGSTTLVPAAFGRARLSGSGRVLVARPPRA
ncbi:class I mannose-6-phosphate isomerase [Schumannella luteola]|uniref:Mannose-6-phosphate isomerase n=1 Tax=Schumannella luteola TaxID=472059 RepID=A0A852YF02_9MICO|nr:class I mannose-6-phosphate isomerase [Schumannella luteola]NYH00343.1 mannose-6-phosphate isomerase [Schumannella luteola]TPX05971.1 carbohydrate kinase [Schumannella luteola]